ncbi:MULTISPECIES: hypothetical protein [unclassified Cupriavidus]|nr:MULTISPECIES: hypothetical protein [unclassified Cupriavidus]
MQLDRDATEVDDPFSIWIPGVIFLAIVPLIWLTGPVKGAAGGAVAAH